MNIRFNRKLFAILISIIALLSVASAKDYSITAGNWQVDFKTNNTLYTEVEWDAPKYSSDLNGIYTIWLKIDPGTKEGSGVIHLREFPKPLPYGKDSLPGVIRGYFAPMNKTPILSDYLIDGTDAVIAEGWNESLGITVYGAMYPIDLDSDGFTQKAAGFISSLDKETNFEILDSLHVEYTGSMPTQTPASTTANNRVNQGGSFVTINDLSTIVKQNAPSIDKISIVPYTTNIDVSYTQIEGSTSSDNTLALAVILQMYASIINRDQSYNGYLRINYKEKGRVIAIYEATAYETRANTDPTTGLLSTDYINQVLSRGKSITYSTYMSDGYDDVTKAVDVPGGRAGPSQGSWL